MAEQAILIQIEHNHVVHWDTDRGFLWEYQKALLLALKEQGVLNDTQYRYAEQRLKEQQRMSVQKIILSNSETGGKGI